MAGALFKEAWSMQHRAALGILCCEDEPRHTRKADGTCAHRARFERYKEFSSNESFILENRCPGAKDEDLRMRGRIAPFHDPISLPGQNAALARKDGANGHLASGGRRLGLLEGERHEFIVPHSRLPRGRAHSTPSPEKRKSEAAVTEAPQGDRVAKAIARAGVCSRRDAEKLIAEGRVAINGETISTPGLRVSGADVVAIDGRPLDAPEPARLWRYHKPSGLVTTHRDPQGRPTVFASLPTRLPRVVSVGRLDFNSEGLLLLTNDGDLARRLEIPAGGWIRRYRVRLFGTVKQADLDALAQGTVIDGVKYGPIVADLERSRGVYSWATVSLKEGKNREVKRVMEWLGLKVARLIRVQFGPFYLGHLSEGDVEEIPARLWRQQLGIGRKRFKDSEETT